MMWKVKRFLFFNKFITTWVLFIIFMHKDYHHFHDDKSMKTLFSGDSNNHIWLNKSGVKRLNTLGHLDQYTWHNMVVLWNSHTVKQSRSRFCLIQIKHYSTRGPIPLCVPHVHCCKDRETVPEQHWNKTRECFTVSMHTATVQKKKVLELEIRVKFKVNNSAKMHLWVMVWINSKWGQFWVWS